MNQIHLHHLDCVLDALDLDGDDGEDLDGDAVELVEAAPGASLRQALVDVAARHVVHLVRLVGWVFSHVVGLHNFPQEKVSYSSDDGLK